MELLDVIKEYGDTRVKNAELEAENKVLKGKLKYYVKKQEVLACLYKSADGESIWVEASMKKTLEKLLDWEH